MLVDSGMEKINFSGGEPFLHQGGKYLGELVRYCKEDLVRNPCYCGELIMFHKVPYILLNVNTHSSILIK
jgi:hypothetical protein